MSQPSITSNLVETRHFPPPAEFSARARVSSHEEYLRRHAASIQDPTAFWESEARELTWQEPWTQALDWQPPFAKWFVGGKLNLSENCVDRHASDPARRDKVAILFEGEPGDTRSITYGELQKEVSKAANVLLASGLSAGDRVIIYMPMVPEAAIAMLACARIGAVHSVIFGGFSAHAIFDRLNDSGATHIITADGGWRRGKIVPLKENVDEALAMGTTPVKSVLVLQRTAHDVKMQPGRDRWWHEEMAAASDHCPPVGLDSEHPLFILYTSGSTGKPKGILHTTGGYAVGTYSTAKNIFDLRDDDIYWCTADVGWVTGHSYIVYGPLANGATVLMYEGAPDTPHFGRFWEIIQKYRVSILYTAPTAIRAFIKWGDEHVTKFDLSSLRLLGSVGEPINPEAWIWYHKMIGGGRCPIVDTWWQTETGAILISPLPGATNIVPGTARSRISGSMPPSWTNSATNAPPTRVAGSSSANPGHPCSARSGAMTTATSPPTGANTPAGMSPAMARAAMRRETSGSSAASMTCSTSPATALAPPKWKAPSSAIRLSRRPPWSAARMRSRVRASSLSSPSRAARNPRPPSPRN